MKDKIILYSTATCPRCNILKAKLNEKEIEYTIIDDVDVLISKHIMSVPILNVNGTAMDFITANKWVNEVNS